MNIVLNCRIRSNVSIVCRSFAGVIGAGAALLLAASAQAQNLFLVDGGGGSIYEFINTNGVLSANPTPFASGLNGPTGLAFDSAGDLFVVVSGGEGGGNIYEFINNNGVLSTNPTPFASGPTSPGALAFSPLTPVNKRGENYCGN